MEAVPEDGALRGVTVVELGARIGVSVAGSALAQLGATVVFVEAPSGGGTPRDKLSVREQFAAGKLSLVPDLGCEQDRALLRELAACCDLLLVSSDIDADEIVDLSARCGAGVVCDLTAFGSSGPLAGRPCSEAQIQALSGILGCTGTPDSGPVLVELPLVEHLAGLYAAGAAICALRQRRIAGPGERIEISLYDVAFSAMTSFLAPAFAGQAPRGTRVGNRHTMSAPWNVFEAADGWILLCSGSDEQWRRICRVIGREDLVDDPACARNEDRVAHVDRVEAAVLSWVRRNPVETCVRRFCEQGLPCGPVAPVEDSPVEANLDHRGMVRSVPDPVGGRQVEVPGSVFRMSRSGGRPLLRIPPPDADRGHVQALLAQRAAAAPDRAGGSGPVPGPLAGLRILEIGHYTTVPIAARTLASLGAEVIKIEPTGGEAVRRWPPARNGQGIFFTFQNSDKQSVCLDLDTDRGRALLTRLVRSADVLVENLRPGALARKGFSPADLHRINPGLVYASVSGFGADSLYPGRAAFDTVIQAMSGLMAVTQVDGMPLKTGPSMSDILGAACTFVAIVAALAHRDGGGPGQSIDISMQDVSAWATQTRWNGRRPASTAAVLADGVLADADRWQLLDGAQRVPILSVPEVLDAPQTRARGLWFDVEMDGARFPLLAVPMRFRRASVRVVSPAPPLGRDTNAIERSLPNP